MARSLLIRLISFSNLKFSLTLCIPATWTKELCVFPKCTELLVPQRYCNFSNQLYILMYAQKYTYSFLCCSSEVKEMNVITLHFTYQTCIVLQGCPQIAHLVEACPNALRQYSWSHIALFSSIKLAHITCYHNHQSYLQNGVQIFLVH